MRLLLLFGILVHGCHSFANPIDEAVRDKLVWEHDRKVADDTSDILLLSAYVLPPIMMLNEDGRDKKLLGFAGVHAVSYGLTKATKLLAGRERPNGENNQSFFSGHTSATFTSAGYLCAVDRGNCAAGIGVALTTGYLRIAADKHWLTDVLVGALVGFSTGHNVPILIRNF